jgi:hypothetical protein
MLEKEYRNGIAIGRVERHRNLATAPVYAQDSFLEEVLMLEKALRTGSFSVTGSEVNEMVVENNLDDKVLVVGGATIERKNGQKRYSKFPTLVMPHSQIILPVNCAEEGESRIRGRYGGNTTIVMPSLRAGNVSQGEAWRRIQDTTIILGRMNATRSYCYADKHANVEDYLDAIGRQPRDGQVGIVAGIRDGDRTIYYTDFFGRHQILSEAYPKLAKCFGIVARVHDGNADNVTVDELAGFLKKFNTAKVSRQKHVGGGNLYLLGNPVKGSILSYKDAPVQVTMRQKVE